MSLEPLLDFNSVAVFIGVKTKLAIEMLSKEQQEQKAEKIPQKVRPKYFVRISEKR